MITPSGNTILVASVAAKLSECLSASLQLLFFASFSFSIKLLNVDYLYLTLVSLLYPFLTSSSPQI